MVTVILGRDGMGDDATEEDYTAWIDFVCDRIDEACGFVVGVGFVANVRDAQNTRYSGGTDAERETVKYQVECLWDEWCEEGAPGVDAPVTPRFQIFSSAGVDLGIYEANSAVGALDAMARAAGYRDEADATAAVGAFEGTVIEIVPEAK